MKSLLFILPVVFLLGNIQAETVHDKHINRTFEIQDIEGWTCLVNVDVTKDKDWPMAKRIMSNHLFTLKRFIKDEVVKDMQKVKIYVDIKQKGKSGAEYHPSKKWLVDNKFSPEKAKCIEISDVSQFIRYTKTQPFVILHELFHSYHDQVLKFDNKEILECFNKAMKTGKYEKVQHISGRQVKHYSCTNHKEYFSEAAEAYFGTNDYFPFVRPQLMEFDPDICEFLKKLAK